MAFRDLIEITVQGGKGGDGAMSMLRLKYMPKGGPDGGNGGNGGSVFLEAISDVSSLDRLVGKRFFRAGTGMSGEGRKRAGKQGEDITLYVPVGTLARDQESKEVLADLVDVGQRICVAKGGLGGRGNAAFATSTRRLPRFFEKGTAGEKHHLLLELQSIADVGLVGYPNAGKSSLLAALSNAKPEIASYPFTTLSPNLGVVERELERLSMADIPGIIAGASQGKGLGLDFLRHISRTRMLLYVLDIVDDLSATMGSLQDELRNYDPTLLERPSLIVLNKIDQADAEDVQEAVDHLTGFGLVVVTISALKGYGLEELIDILFQLLPEKPIYQPTPQASQIVHVRPIEVIPEDGGWRVRGDELEQMIQRFDANNRDAVAYLHHHFMALGVNKLLKKAGAQNGQDIFIADAVFEYFDEEKMPDHSTDHIT